MSLRTPLGRVLGHGSAKSGTDHWWAQRVSGVALVVLGLWFAWSLTQLHGLAYGNVIEFLRVPLNGILLSLLCITVAYHSYLGIQVVVEDYVHSAALKVGSLIASRFAHVVVAAACVYSILRIGLGA
jgi:succinate dehydrogenase / fumarate reductase membrane anchor subunit